MPDDREKDVEQALNDALNNDYYWTRQAARKAMKAMNMPVPEM